MRLRVDFALEDLLRALHCEDRHLRAQRLLGAEKILKREVDAKAHAQLLSGLEAELR